MKNSQRGFVRAVILLLVFVIVGGGVAYAYTKDSPVYDRFYSAEQREKREMARLFPGTLGSYVLFARGPEKIEASTQCSKIEENSETKWSGLKGELCKKTFLARYNEIGTNKVVFVHLIQFTAGKEIYKDLIGKIAKREQLGSYQILRVGGHELGWFPVSDFDMVGTQEGVVKPEAGGGETMNYSAKATGDNPVTQYFLTKYAPLVTTGTSINSSSAVYSSQAECERVTGKTCGYQMCDYVPAGKSYEEVCGRNFEEGWVVKATNSPEQIHEFTAEDMKRGCYYGSLNQKKPGTPSNWVHGLEGTRSAAWCDPTRPNSMPR